MPPTSPIDRDYVLATLQEVVRIDSRNPGLEEGAPGERRLAEHVAAALHAMGWRPELQDLGDDRANVVARRRGSGHGPSLMINVHLDTVGVAGMPDPFSGELRDGRVWGRGSQDTKGGVAATLGLAKAMSDADVTLQGDLVLAFVADEENESIGTEYVMREDLTDAAIVLEPSDLNVSVAHRGYGVFRLHTEGRTAHGGLPEIGRDANRHMAHVLVGLDALNDRWAEERTHPMLGAATLHVPVLAGGRQLFVYAPECTAHLECRTVPGQTSEQVLDEIRAVLEAVRGRVQDFRGSVLLEQWRPPHVIAEDAPLVRTVRAAGARVRGEEPAIIAHTWWEDSGLLGAAGVETLVTGPIGEGLHTEEEWVDAESVVQLAAILYESARDYCGVDGDAD